MTVQAAINGLNDILKGINGLRVHDNPPESLNQFPCAITYIQEGTMEDAAMGGWSFHTLIAEIYINRQLLPQAIDAAKPWPDTVFNALRAATADDPTWGGAIAHMVQPLRYRAGPMQYGGPDMVHYGVRFTIVAKVLEQ